MSRSHDANDSQIVHGGQIPGVPQRPAFVLEANAASQVPVLIAAPHGGRAYSSSLLADFRPDEAVLLKLEDRHADMLARGVAAATGAALLVAEAPRALVDLNRAPSDVDWDMFVREARPADGGGVPSRRARGGLGLIPRRLPGVGDLWRRRFERADLAARLDGVHEPYHAALGEALAALRTRWGAALLIDLHSMPPLSPRPGIAGAQVVVGDRFGASCHASVVAASFAHFAQTGREAAHNRPYAGGYVLDRHADPREGIHALQIEIDRSRYLDSQMVEPAPEMAGVIVDLVGLVQKLAAIVADIGRERLERGLAGRGQGDAQWPLAAE